MFRKPWNSNLTHTILVKRIRRSNNTRWKQNPFNMNIFRNQKIIKPTAEDIKNSTYFISFTSSLFFKHQNRWKIQKNIKNKKSIGKSIHNSIWSTRIQSLNRNINGSKHKHHEIVYNETSQKCKYYNPSIWAFWIKLRSLSLFFPSWCANL